MSGIVNTIRRRGGLELTSRVVGGLWVVGQRTVPSPYNAAATAALKAAFPTQWAIIRDYGWEHPEIVPYVNQDPMIVCSFGIEGMPIRYLVGDGSSYIDFNQRFKNTGLPIDMKAQVMRTAITRTNYIFGNYSVSGTGASCFEFAIRVNDVVIWASPDLSQNSYSQVGPVNLHFRLKSGGGRQIGINGTDTDYAHTQATIFNNANNYMTLFGCVQESVGMAVIPIGHTELTLGSTELDLYPFKDKTTGNMEMLNLNTGEYEHRVGSFTEVFYLPDGTPWTPPSS